MSQCVLLLAFCLPDTISIAYESKLQDQGYGTLIVNIGIQTLVAYYGIARDDDKAKDIIIKGKTSDEGDADSEPERSKCRNRRNYFWRRHGLKLKDPMGYVTPIRCTLADLIIKSGKITANGTSVDVKLEDFWEQCKAPVLFQRDIDTLLSLDIDQFDYDNCPTTEAVDASLDRHIAILRAIHTTCWAVLSMFITYASFIYLEVNTAFPISLAGAMLSHVLTLLLINHIGSSLPSYRGYDDLSEKRGNTICGIKDYIQHLEEHHNGFLWRLYDGLKSHNEFLGNENFDRLSNESKKQYSHTIADSYNEYLNFIDKAKAVVVSQNIKGHPPA